MVRKESTVRSPGSQRTPKGIVQGQILVDPNTGDPLLVVLDENGQPRLGTDTKVTLDASALTITLTPDDDGVFIGDKITGTPMIVESDGSINVNTALDAQGGDNVAISSHPLSNQIFAEQAEVLIDDNPAVIFTYSSTSDNTRLLNVECTSSGHTVFTLKIDGVAKRVKRNSESERNVIFEFKEHRQIPSGKDITIEAQITRFFSTHAPYNTFVSLEGYLCS